MNATPELTFRGLDTCDGSGGPLTKKERLAGLCPKCQTPASKKPIPRDRGDCRIVEPGAT